MYSVVFKHGNKVIINPYGEKIKLNLKIGYYSGTFDPFHLRHFEIVKFCTKIFDEVRIHPILFPQGKNPVNLNHRINMIQLVIKNIKNVYIVVYDKNLKYEDLQKFRFIHGIKDKVEGLEIVDVLGEDNLEYVTSKEEVESIACFSRFDLYDSLLFKRNDKLKYKLFSLGFSNISSTLIRSNIRNGVPFEKLVNKEVYEYIVENSLYGFNLRD